MAQPIKHPKANVTFTSGPGDEDRVGVIECQVKFVPGTERIASVTSAWLLTPEEIEEINQTGIIMMNQLYGLAPHFITTPTQMAEFVLDHGADSPRRD